MYYLLGGAGYDNFGDELMVRCWLDLLTENGRKKDKIIVDGFSGARLDVAFAGNYRDVIYGNLINGLSETGKATKFWDAFHRGLTFYARGGFNNYPKLKPSADLLLNATVLHLHGGGYLNKHFPRKGFLLGLIIATSRQTGAKLVATGLGLTPLDIPPSNLQAEVSEAIAQFPLIETRDENSAELLRKISPFANIVSGLDDTFVGDMAYVTDKKHRLHLSWNFPRTKDPEFARVFEYAQKNQDRYDEVVFWTCAGNDQGTWDLISQQMPNARELTFADMLHRPLPVSEGDHMLTARFHPHLIGARGGAVGGYFSPGSYYDVKHGSVCELGSGFFRIGTDPIKYESFAECANSLFRRAPALQSMKAELYENIKELIAKK